MVYKTEQSNISWSSCKDVENRQRMNRWTKHTRQQLSLTCQVKQKQTDKKKRYIKPKSKHEIFIRKYKSKNIIRLMSTGYPSQSAIDVCNLVPGKISNSWKIYLQTPCKSPHTTDDYQLESVRLSSMYMLYPFYQFCFGNSLFFLTLLSSIPLLH